MRREATWWRGRANDRTSTSRGRLIVLIAASALAQGSQFFRIGTGSTGGTYFPIGAILASAISNPPGSRECDRGGSCGVPGLIAVAQSTHGSVENVRAIGGGTLDSALRRPMSPSGPITAGILRRERKPIKLRAIANLYPEMSTSWCAREPGS